MSALSNTNNNNNYYYKFSNISISLLHMFVSKLLYRFEPWVWFDTFLVTSKFTKMLYSFIFSEQVPWGFFWQEIPLLWWYVTSESFSACFMPTHKWIEQFAVFKYCSFFTGSTDICMIVLVFRFYWLCFCISPSGCQSCHRRCGRWSTVLHKDLLGWTKKGQFSISDMQVYQIKQWKFCMFDRNIILSI